MEDGGAEQKGFEDAEEDEEAVAAAVERWSLSSGLRRLSMEKGAPPPEDGLPREDTIMEVVRGGQRLRVTTTSDFCILWLALQL